MAETLLAILLVTTSARGPNLVFRWPELPAPSPRLSRPLPDSSLALSSLDNPWRASHSSQGVEKAEPLPPHDYGHDPAYSWQRTVFKRDRSASSSTAHHHNASRRSSPERDSYDSSPIPPDEYEYVLGYKAPYLVKMLCAQPSMCHAKFELIVDDLAFIGHPVCADPDGGWRFKPEKIRSNSRTRASSEGFNSASHSSEDPGPSGPNGRPPQSPSEARSPLQAFHLVLVLDLPDPSSSASGNISKYFNILYEQIAFTLTAVLYQEQVLSDFVENECDKLLTLKDSCSQKGTPYSTYVADALEISSIASTMKTIYEAVKASDIAYVTINYLPLQLQLPPHIDALLHSADDQYSDFVDPSDEDSHLVWGQSLSLGWRLPTMAPWKALLLLDDEGDMDPYSALRGPQTSAEDRKLAEGIVRFLETVSVTLSLVEMANILDWNLESQVYPIVRWLVLHRRAKIVDVVHAGLKTVFGMSPNFDEPLSVLTAKFKDAFPHSYIPPLPKLLAAISTSTSKQSDNHFFASVVKDKELINTYHDVVLWMLKRNMLVTLHLRIRIVITQELKARVTRERELHMAQKSALGQTHLTKLPPDIGEEKVLISTSGSMKYPSLVLSSKTAHQFSRRIPSNDSDKSRLSELDFHVGEHQLPQLNSVSDSSNSEIDEDDSGWDTTEDHLWPSIITDPGKATPMQRRWLSAMSDGKDPVIAKRFEQINQYFDGKRSDDEILYRADISKKQLREVLHHYEEYLETFLHSS